MLCGKISRRTDNNKYRTPQQAGRDYYREYADQRAVRIGQRGSGRKAFFVSLSALIFFVRLRFKLSILANPHKFKEEKNPEISEHKWFRSLRAFIMSVYYQTVSRKGCYFQKVSNYVNRPSRFDSVDETCYGLNPDSSLNYYSGCFR